MAKAETQETWRSCASWLLQLEVIPKNHRVMTPDATFQDLAYTLRDGVILCHMASTIDESSINPRAINHRPQLAQFLCLQNIRHFLTACKVSKQLPLSKSNRLFNYLGLHIQDSLIRILKMEFRLFSVMSGVSHGD